MPSTHFDVRRTIFFPVFYSFGAGDLDDSGRAVQILAVGFVSLSWLLFGVTLAAVVARLGRRWQQATSDKSGP